MAHPLHRSRPRLRVVDGGAQEVRRYRLLSHDGYKLGHQAGAGHPFPPEVPVNRSLGDPNLVRQPGRRPVHLVETILQNTRFDQFGHDKPHMSWLDREDRNGLAMSMDFLGSGTNALTGLGISPGPAVWRPAGMASESGQSVVKAWRNHFGWSSQDLAERMGVAVKTVSRLENGERMNDRNRELLAQAFGVTPQHFFAAGIMPPSAEATDPADPEECYSDADFMVDVMQAVRAFYRAEHVDLAEAQIIKAAYQVHSSIAPKTTNREARMMLLATHLDGRRQALRDQKLAERVGARVEKTA